MWSTPERQPREETLPSLQQPGLRKESVGSGRLRDCSFFAASLFDWKECEEALLWVMDRPSGTKPRSTTLSSGTLSNAAGGCGTLQVVRGEALPRVERGGGRRTWQKGGDEVDVGWW